MRLSGVAAALFVSLIVETASAEPVALHFSGTVRTSLYGDVINGEFDWSTLPNGSAVSGCLSYDAAQAPTNVVLDGQVAVFYPLSASEVFVAVEVSMGEDIQSGPLLVADHNSQGVLEFLAKADVHHACVERFRPHAHVEPTRARPRTGDRARQNDVFRYGVRHS